MSSVLKAALPVLGFAFGGPIGAELGIGATAGTIGGAALGGALGGAAGGGGWKGAAEGGLLGGLGGAAGSYFSGLGSAAGAGGAADSGGLGLSAGYTGAGTDFSMGAGSGAGLGLSGSAADAGYGLGAGSGTGLGLTADAGILGGGIGSDLAATSAGLAPEEAALSNGTIGTAASGIPTSSGGLTSYLSNLLGGHTAVSGGGIAGRGVGGYLGPIGQALSISSGLYGMEQSKRLQALAQQQAATQSPFDPYRAQYAQKLQALEADPNSITALPGYQAGLEAVKRSMASQGFNGSGNMMAALQKYGGDFYNNALNQYATLAGAGAAPGAGAGLAVQGSALGTQLMGSSLASLGYGVAGR